MESVNEHDEEFKKKLFDFEESVSDDVWKGISGELDKKPGRNRGVFWWIPVGLILILGAGFWFKTNLSKSEAFHNSSAVSVQNQVEETEAKVDVDKSTKLDKSLKSTNNEPAKKTERLAESNTVSQDLPTSKTEQSAKHTQPMDDEISPNNLAENNSNENTTKKWIVKNLKSTKTLVSGSSEWLAKENSLKQPEKTVNQQVSAIEPNAEQNLAPAFTAIIEEGRHGNAPIAYLPESNQKRETKREVSSKINPTASSILNAESGVLTEMPIRLATVAQRKIEAKPISLQLITADVQRLDSMKEEPKEIAKKRWSFGPDFGLLGAIQQVKLNRQTDEWNNTSFALVDALKSSRMIEFSMHAAFSITSKLGLAANFGLSHWTQTIEYQSKIGLKAEYTLNEVNLPNGEIRFDGLPINDNQFTKSVKSDFTQLWFQPKLEIQPWSQFPLKFKPGYQFFVAKLGNSNQHVPNGASFELTYSFKKVEVGMKSLFYHQQNVVQFVPQSQVNTFWLGGSVGWRF